MIHLNLFPIYKDELKNKTMTTSFRLGDKTDFYKIGDVCVLTSNWIGEPEIFIGKIKITQCYLKKINELTDADLKGHSKHLIDNWSFETLIRELSFIYRKVLVENDCVTVIKWEPLYSMEQKQVTVSRPTVFERKEI